MFILSKLRPLYFFTAFAVGLLACYMMAPTPEVVVKFPSPYNAGQITYTDRARGCFQIEAQKVACPADGANVRSQPLMEDFSRRGASPPHFTAQQQ